MPHEPTSQTESAMIADLTDAQRQAVLHTEGPLLVLAAAGSGKTRVITQRAAHIVNEIGVAPWNVLCITFTNKAAGEMRERVGRLLSARRAESMPISTFHALCAKLLRKYAQYAHIEPNFSIFDTADQKRAMKQAFKDLDISTDHFKPEAVLNAISNEKNDLIDDEAYAKGATDFWSRSIAKLYTKYQHILTDCSALDFDDLLLKTAQMLQRNEEIRAELQERYAYVQIDEYQDTNHAQFVIAHCLAAAHRNICVVGDPDQSIYGWRGANLRNILDFEKHYEDAMVIQLGQNYRSTPEILKAADTLIKHNKKRKDKALYTENDGGEKIRVIQTGDEEHEAEQVVEYLRKYYDAGIPWSQMAVFYRINALSRTVEDILMRSSIPYQIARGTAFYQRKEIKDAMAYVRVLANPGDEVSLLRVINTPRRGIGDTAVQHMRAFAVANGVSLWDAMCKVSDISALTTRAGNSVRQFVGMIEGWSRKVREANVEMLGFVPAVRDVVEMVLRDSGLEAFYKDEKTGDEEKLANLYELVTAAQRFDDGYFDDNLLLEQKLHDWLEQVALVSDVDGVAQNAGGATDENKAGEGDTAAESRETGGTDADEQPDASAPNSGGSGGGGAVTLMTLHAAKGLEFQVVTMIGLEEGLLPHSRAKDDLGEMEEERRLAFVGITRAERHLQMSYSRYRTVRGLRERTIPSPFLAEMGRDVVEFEDLTDYVSAGWDDGYATTGGGGYGRKGGGRYGRKGDYEDDFGDGVGGGSGGTSGGGGIYGRCCGTRT